MYTDLIELSVHREATSAGRMRGDLDFRPVAPHMIAVQGMSRPHPDRVIFSNSAGLHPRSFR
jgi:hypothetical protein